MHKPFAVSAVLFPHLLPLSPLLQSYMEDHLKNKDRLEKEWEALCAYQAEPNACTIGMKDGNAKKNRSAAVVACKQAVLFLSLEIPLLCPLLARGLGFWGDFHRCILRLVF